MKFKYSAVGDNTQASRECLEKLGYKPNMISEHDNMLYTREYFNGWMYSGCPYMNIPDSYINCLGNPQLFQAVTAMREDSDKWQWFEVETPCFEFDKNDCYENRLMLCTDSDVEIFSEKIGINIVCWRKATLADLQEHFK